MVINFLQHVGKGRLPFLLQRLRKAYRFATDLTAIDLKREAA